MIPIRDETTAERMHMVTMCIILVNFLFFAYQCYLGLGLFGFNAEPAEQFIRLYGVVPERFVRIHDVREFGTVFISMFLHSGWMHIIGNMWALHLFGDNVEDHLGHLQFLVFYLLAGVAAEAAELFVNPGFTGPSIGASGAVAGVIGAYLVLHPNANILCFWPNWFTLHKGGLIKVPAYAFIVLWFAGQIIGGLVSDPKLGGVAYAAHIGGFCAGLCVYFTRRHPDSVDAEREVEAGCVERIIGKVDYEALDLRPPECHSRGWRFERAVLVAETIAVIAAIVLSAYLAFTRITAEEPVEAEVPPATPAPPPTPVQPVKHSPVTPVSHTQTKHHPQHKHPQSHHPAKKS